MPFLLRRSAMSGPRSGVIALIGDGAGDGVGAGAGTGTGAGVSPWGAGAGVGWIGSEELDMISFALFFLVLLVSDWLI